MDFSRLERRALVTIAAFVFQGCDARNVAPDAIDADAVPRLVLEEETRIGSRDDPDYGFSRIGNIDVGSDGSLYVFESVDRQIRVYSTDGDLVLRIGRAGMGPGEFRGSVRLGIVGDTLWTSDGQYINLFTLQGQLMVSSQVEQLSTPLHGEGSSTRLEPADLGSDGLFVSDQGVRTLAEVAAVTDTIHIPRVRFGLDGQVVDTVEVYPVPKPHWSARLIDVGRSQFSIPLPAATEPIRVNMVDGAFVVELSGDQEFVVTRYNIRGERVASERFRYEPIPYPEEVLDSAVSRTLRFGDNEVRMLMLATETGMVLLEQHASDSTAARKAIREELNWPEFQPPVNGYLRGGDGSLWLRRENSASDVERWFGIDADLRPIGRLDLPRSLQLEWIGGDQMWVVHADEVGVPWLIRYRLRQAN